MKGASYRYPPDLSQRIIKASEADFVDGVEWLELDCDLGKLFGKLARRFVSSAAGDSLSVDLIASHGQTIRHLPHPGGPSATLQIGEPSFIASTTQLPVVADFRRSDIAAGGEGAPLSPILHEYLFRDPRRWRAVVNIGGIANATILPPTGSKQLPSAADCGPGNMLIDSAMQVLFGLSYDRNGRIAAQGRVISEVVDSSLRNPYFGRKPPKSTGRELFGRGFLEKIMQGMKRASPRDCIATITEITVASIADFILRICPAVDEILLCGGGAKNSHLIGRLSALLKGKTVSTTARLGYDPDYIEAFLWAFLAFRFIGQNPINMNSYTGAKGPYIPGKLCLP
jgi:anhydro-N-acetylmuramic acid kinase